jgi:hypothetical protein
MRTPSRAVLVLSIAAAALSCRSATAPVTHPRVAVAAEALGTGAERPEASVAAGRLRSVLISGGSRLTCGVSAAAGWAELRGEALRVRLTFRPLGSCPFNPTKTRYEAIVIDVPPGWYDLVVAETYWPDEPERVVLRERLYVSGQ